MKDDKDTKRDDKDIKKDDKETKEDNKDSNPVTRVIDFISSNLKVLSVISTLVLISLGWSFYHVSPLNTFKEIAYKQEQENLKKDFVQFHNDLGDSFLDVEQLDAAKFEYEQVLEVDPLNQKARFSLFKCKVFEPISNETGYDPEISQKRLEMILNKDPNDPHANLYLGDLYKNIDQEKALEYYGNAIKIDPYVAAAYSGMGDIHNQRSSMGNKSIRLNETKEAAKNYEKALNISPWNQLYLNNLAVQYYKLEEYNKSIDKRSLLLKLDDRYLLAYYGIAGCYQLIGDLKSARFNQEKLITLIEDRNVTDLKKNKHQWNFDTKSGVIHFNNFTDKKYLAYYNYALTCYLLGNENETIQYLKKANDLHIDKETELNVKTLVACDIDNIQSKQPGFLNRTEEFRKKFLAQSM